MAALTDEELMFKLGQASPLGHISWEGGLQAHGSISQGGAGARSSTFIEAQIRPGRAHHDGTLKWFPDKSCWFRYTGGQRQGLRYRERNRPASRDQHR